MANPLLLIEDDPAICSMVSHALRSGGYEVVVAETGLEALEHLGSSRSYDAVILDLAIPGYSGLAILEHFRRNRPELLSRVIVVTAYASRLDNIDRRNVHKIILKPFDIDELVEAVNDVTKSGTRLT